MTETFDHAGYRVTIEHDDDAEDPRDMSDPMGELVYWFSNGWNTSKLGDKSLDYCDRDDFADCETIHDVITKLEDMSGQRVGVLVPVNVSGGNQYPEHMSAYPEAEYWSNERDHHNGFMVVWRKNVLAEYSAKRITKRVRENAIACLVGEAQEYSDWLSGDVYRWVIERVTTCECCGSEKTEHVDSLCGMYGFEYAKSTAIEEIDAMNASKGVAA